MPTSKKYYYIGFECTATFQEKTGNWQCVVENVNYPFMFEASEERFIQGNLEWEVNDYIEKCRVKGIAPKKDSIIDTITADRHTAVVNNMRDQQKARERKEKQKEREFNRSYWKYLAPVMLAAIPAIGFAMLAKIGEIIPFTIFFPYRADVVTKRLPLLTISVCIICIIVFIFQCLSDTTYNKNCSLLMQQENMKEYNALRSSASSDNNQDCELLAYLRTIKYPESAIREISGEIVQSKEYRGKWKQDEIDVILTEASKNYAATVPESLTDKLSFKSNRYDVIGTYTAIFAHASWDHLLFNLIFFFAFAASVELLAGHLFFMLMFVISPILMAIFFSNSFVAAGDIHGGARLGLSGVCNVFMAGLLVLKPRMNIKTLFWFLVIFRTYSVPLWFIAAWWISWDISALLHPSDDGIGHISHFTGACTGALAAFIYRLLMEKKINHDALEVKSEAE